MINFIIELSNAVFGSLVLILFVVIVIRLVVALVRRFPLDRRVRRWLWVVSAVFVAVTPFLMPIAVETAEEMEVLRFGFPNPFVYMHRYYSENGVRVGELPLRVTLGDVLSQGGFRFDFRLGEFGISWVSVYVVGHLVVYWVKFRKRASE